MTREELIERICPTDCLDKCFEGNISCDICDKITGLMFDEHEKQIRADERNRVLSTLSKLIESDYNSKECKLLLSDLSETILERLKGK